MTKKRPAYNQELDALQARLERAADRSPNADQKKLLEEAANNAANANRAGIDDETRAVILELGRILLRATDPDPKAPIAGS